MPKKRGREELMERGSPHIYLGMREHSGPAGFLLFFLGFPSQLANSALLSSLCTASHSGMSTWQAESGSSESLRPGLQTCST